VKYIYYNFSGSYVCAEAFQGKYALKILQRALTMTLL
jgi:hypothetical protein